MHDWYPCNHPYDYWPLMRSIVFASDLMATHNLTQGDMWYLIGTPQMSRLLAMHVVVGIPPLMLNGSTDRGSATSVNQATASSDGDTISYDVTE
jgi:hypothetical protein